MNNFCTTKSLLSAIILVVGAALAWPSQAGLTTPTPQQPNPPLNDPPCQQMCCGFGGGGFGGGGGGGFGGFGGGSAGKPVLLWDGSERLSETDLVVKSTFPIRLVRRYNSVSRYDSTLGYGWAFEHDRAVFEYPDDVVVMRSGCGIRSAFSKSGSTYVTPPERTQGVLTRNSDGSFEFRYYNGTRDVFDANGWLVREYDANGLSHEFVYDTNGKMKLEGVPYKAVEPTAAKTVAYLPHVTRIQERAADGSLTGVYVDFTYNATTGRLQQAQSHDGRFVNYTHDVFGSSTRGNLARVDAPAGLSHVYGYTDSNDIHNLTSIQRGTRSGITAYVNTYGADDRVLTQTHGSRVLVFEYPSVLRRIVKEDVRDDAGALIHTAQTEYIYNEDGSITNITDANGNKVQYTYHPTKKTRASYTLRNGTSHQVVREHIYTSDSEGRLAEDKVTLATGEIVRRKYVYDAGRIASEEVTYEWPSPPSPLQPVPLTSKSKIDYVYSFGAAGAVTRLEIGRRVDSATTLTTAHVYDGKGRLARTVLPDGVELRYGFGIGLLPTSVQYQTAAGTAIANLAQTIAYDPDNQVDTVTDASGAVTNYDYDDLGRLTSVTNALGQQTIYSYTDDLLTQVERGRTATDGEGQVTRHVHDGRGRKLRTERKREDGQFIAFETAVYDSAGHVLRRLDGLNKATTYAYDPMGNVLTVKDALNHLTTYQYDEAGNRIRQLDPNNHVTEYGYDGLDRLVETKQIGGSDTLITAIRYDALGNQISVTDAKGQTTSFEYDDASRKLKETKPVGQFTTYRYDARGRMEKTVNARNQAIVNEYETWGPLKEQRHYGDAAATNLVRTITYGRDLVGNLTSTTDDSIMAGDLWSAQYDLLRRETMMQAHYAESIVTPIRISSEYDRFGIPKSNAVRFGMQPDIDITFGFDKRNRLTTATSAAGAVTLAHDEADHRTTMDYPNGRTQLIGRNDDGTISFVSVGTGKTPVQRFDYMYDAAHNITSMPTTQGTYSFGYDHFDRLTSATYPASLGLSSETYEYDAVGNRELPGNSSYYDYDGNNRMLAGPASYVYDGDGNQTNANVTGGNQRTSTYDVGSRLTQILDHAAGAPTSTDITYTYAHDPAGRRLSATKTQNGTSATTYYLWKGDRIVAQVSATATEVYQYLPGSYSPVLARIGSKWYGVHADHLDTPRVLTDDGGTVAWLGLSRAFGGEFGAGQTNAVEFDLRFPGQIQDDSGRYYNYFRDYEPALGRYAESDPIGMNGGPNTYLYVDSSPMMSFDPKGLLTVRDCLGCDQAEYEETKRSADSWCTWASQGSNIRDVTIRRCIKKECRNGTISCKSDCKPRTRCGRDVGIPRGYFNRSEGAVVCLNQTAASGGRGSTAIHEIAHSCDWKHGDGGGVPNDPGIDPPCEVAP